MAWVEKRGKRFRLLFRLNNEKYTIGLKETDPCEVEACLARVEENLRFVERGRLVVPEGVDLALFLLSDGRLEKKVEVVRVPGLSALFGTCRTFFTVGAKEKITLKMENIHLNHLIRILGDRPASEVTAGAVQRFVDVRIRETFKGQPIKPTTVRKAVATLRFVMNWAVRQGHGTTKFPQVELAFPKEHQAEPFRTYDQIAAIIARGSLDARRIRELWDGLFLDPQQVAEALAIARNKTRAPWLHPFLVAAAHTGARRSELFRARVEDFDFDGKLVLLRELKRSRAKETFRTVDLTPFLEKVLRRYFDTEHPGGVVAFCSAPNCPLVDCQAWRTFRSAVAESRWKVLRDTTPFATRSPPTSRRPGWISASSTS